MIGAKMDRRTRLMEEKAKTHFGKSDNFLSAV
jgi:hypothetical protein